jgi:hypothetical protein
MMAERNVNMEIMKGIRGEEKGKEQKGGTSKQSTKRRQKEGKKGKEGMIREDRRRGEMSRIRHNDGRKERPTDSR